MNLYEKLVEVRKSVTYLKKTEQSENQKYAYVSSGQVLASVKAKMDELKILLIPQVMGHKVEESVVEYTEKDRYGNVKPKRTITYFTELDIDMTWVNAEKSDEAITCKWYGQGVDIAGEKGVGKALTYAEKYFILKFFNIPTDKDDPDTKPDSDPEPVKPEKSQEPEPRKQYQKPYQKLRPEPPKPDSDKAFTKPTTEMLKALNTLAQRKGIDLSMHGVGWTGKAASKYWTMQDYLKVKAELEKVVDKHEQGDPDGQANKGSGAKIYGK